MLSRSGLIRSFLRWNVNKEGEHSCPSFVCGRGKKCLAGSSTFTIYKKMALSCPENEAHFLQAKQHDFRGEIQIRTVLRTNSWLGLQTPLLTSKRNQYFVPLHSSASAHDDLSTYWPTDLQGNQTLKRNLSCVFPIHIGHCSFLWLHYQTILTLGAVARRELERD